MLPWRPPSRGGSSSYRLRHDRAGAGCGQGERPLNYLVHLYLSAPTDDCRLGNLMGDFVKGRIDAGYPQEVLRGIWQHRRIDALAHSCLPCRRSRSRIDPYFGHFRGILVDIFYDHLLAVDWPRFSPQPLDAFAEEIYSLLSRNLHCLPPGLQQIAPRMIRDNWLLSYRDPDTIGRVLERVARRFSRPTPLGQALPELLRERQGLATDCEAFLQEGKACLSRGPTDNARIVE